MTTIITVQRGSDSFIAADTRASGRQDTFEVSKVIAHASGKAFFGFAGNAETMQIYQDIIDAIFGEQDIVEKFFKEYRKVCEEQYLRGENSIIAIENGASYSIKCDMYFKYENNLQVYCTGSGGESATGSFNTFVATDSKYSNLENLDEQEMKELLVNSIVIGAKLDPYTNENIEVYATKKEYEKPKTQEKFQLSMGNSAEKLELPMVIATNEITAKNQQYSKKSLQEVVNLVNSKEIAVMIDHGDNATYGKQELGVWKNAKLIEKSSNCFEVYATAVMKKTPLTQSIVEQKSIFGASMRCLHPQGAKMSNGCEIVEEIKDVLEISLTENPTMSETRSLKMALENTGRTRKELIHFLQNNLRLSNSERRLSNSECELIFSTINSRPSKEFQGNLELTAQQGNLVMASEVELMKQNYESEIAELKSNLAKSQNDSIRLKNVVAELNKFVNKPLKKIN